MKRKLLALSFLAAVLSAAVVPAGTDLQVRLQTPVGTINSKPKDPVEAVLIAPVMNGDQIVIPAGTALRGHVQSVQHAANDGKNPAVLGIEWDALRAPSGQETHVPAKLVTVDNARESVDERGRVVGILASETLTSRMDQGIGKLSERYADLAGLLGAIKGAVIKQADPEITYEPGTEMTVELTKPLDWKGPIVEPDLDPIPLQADLEKMVRDQPYRTVAVKPPRPSDMTNLLFVGSAQEVQDAFLKAGWVPPTALNGNSTLETIKAVAEARGYKEGPMSVLLLDGEPPAFEFQKANNTFAQRHHLRIWARPGRWAGQPIWVCAATHDIGIDYSDRDRTFIHRIDPQLDKERAKVVSDLLFTGMVKSLALVDRPGIPLEGMTNATGDQLITDGRMAIVILK